MYKEKQLPHGSDKEVDEELEQSLLSNKGKDNLMTWWSVLNVTKWQNRMWTEQWPPWIQSLESPDWTQNNGGLKKQWKKSEVMSAESKY